MRAVTFLAIPALIISSAACTGSGWLGGSNVLYTEDGGPSQLCAPLWATSDGALTVGQQHVQTRDGKSVTIESVSLLDPVDVELLATWVQVPDPEVDGFGSSDYPPTDHEAYPDGVRDAEGYLVTPGDGHQIVVGVRADPSPMASWEGIRVEYVDEDGREGVLVAGNISGRVAADDCDTAFD